jgi:glycosyltransferase involved in cell wall biosynthesis
VSARGQLGVAVVVDSDTFGGAEVYARHLLRWMPPWIRRDLVVSEPVAEHFTEPGLVHHMATVPLYRHQHSAPQVAAALAALAPDVVQVNLVDPGSNLGCLAAAAHCAPTVPTLHLQGALPAQPLPPVAYAVAPSAVIAAQFRDELGVPASRVIRVRHGVELPRPPAPSSPDDTVVTIGAVARLTEQKGLDLLLDATRLLVGEGRRLRLIIAGSGREEAGLRRRADGLPVRFLGLCRDVPAFLRQLDVFCLPSRREALSLALLEAVAHGLPCVTTAVGDTTQALHGAALIVEPEDLEGLAAALRQLIENSELREDLGARARERAVRDFDVRRMAARTAAVLRRASFTRAADQSAPAHHRPVIESRSGNRWDR